MVLFACLTSKTTPDLWVPVDVRAWEACVPFNSRRFGVEIRRAIFLKRILLPGQRFR